MKKADVKVGETYLMNHTSGKIHVRILREIKRNRGRIDNPSVVTHWRAMNLATLREIEIKSAVETFRRTLNGPQAAGPAAGPHNPLP